MSDTTTYSAFAGTEEVPPHLQFDADRLRSLFEKYRTAGV